MTLLTKVRNFAGALLRLAFAARKQRLGMPRLGRPDELIWFGVSGFRAGC